jgi:hypothetical protein
MNGLSCFVCGSSNAKEEDWSWYDGKIRHICSVGCRVKMGDKLNENPSKTYLAHLKKRQHNKEGI